MFRVVSQLVFDEVGNCHQVSVELRAKLTNERLALVVSPVGPFDDFSDVYQEAYERCLDLHGRALPGLDADAPQAHPRVLLRRATDPQPEPCDEG